jgi:predicted 3-demethylubiquinone-9 3-methyltransferase (glyoxalase superfamily)
MNFCPFAQTVVFTFFSPSSSLKMMLTFVRYPFPNPSISLFVTLESKEEIKVLHDKLSEGGNLLMDLAEYPWSPYYSFFQDKFGVAWQFFLGKYSDVNQAIVPCFLFTKNQFGKADEAIHFYSSLFPDTSIHGISHYVKGMFTESNVVQHGQFSIKSGIFMAMDGPGENDFAFSEGMSLVIECENQEEIDHFWNGFLENGGQEQQCGWIKDKFGVSWQVVPKILKELMSNPEKGKLVMDAFLKMKKFDIATLLAV